MWRLLAPAFVYFFKLLYPFAASNDPRRRMAAAAGGCMHVRTDVLRGVGGFAAIRGALIDDCTLAGVLKRASPPIWLGMSRSVSSLRVYAELGDFWRMVSRSAFTQLRYSTALLLLSTGVIGHYMPLEKIAHGVKLASAQLGSDEQALILGRPRHDDHRHGLQARRADRLAAPPRDPDHGHGQGPQPTG